MGKVGSYDPGTTPDGTEEITAKQGAFTRRFTFSEVASVLAAADVLAKLLTVDGAESGLDADTVDGQEAAAFAAALHTHTLAAVTDAGALAAGNDAGDVPFTPAGGIAATDVQAAIVELDGEKQPLDADLTAIAALTRTRGDLIRGGASAWEDFAAATADTFVGGDGTDVGVRTAAQVLTSLGIEAGTFTPAVAPATVGTWSVAYGVRLGNYLKVLNYYIFNVTLTFTPTIGTGSGDVRFDVPVANGSRVAVGFVASINNDFTWPASRTALSFQTQASVAYGSFYGIGSLQNESAFQVSNLSDGTLHIVRYGGVLIT